MWKLRFCAAHAEGHRPAQVRSRLSLMGRNGFTDGLEQSICEVAGWPASGGGSPCTEAEPGSEPRGGAHVPLFGCRNFPPSIATPGLDFDVEGPRQLQEAAQHLTFHETLAAHYLPMDACAPGVQYAQALHIPQARVEKPASIPGFKAALQHGVVSVGTIGHPSTCADSCPYVKRRGGCKDGAKCPKCHLCFWQRPSVRRVASVQEAEVEASGSATSMTLPPPPPPPHRTPRPSGAQQACGPVFQVVSAQDDVETQDGLPSVGSIGHPHSCGLACKYYSKGKGCKDGRWCIRCHACQWRRYNA